MCSECGEIYTRAGYKIVQVPMAGANPQPSAIVIKTKQLVVTQELAGSPGVAEEETKQPAVTQEPTCFSRIVEEDIEPPRPTQTSTEQKYFTDAYTQTEPFCVSNAHTETSSFQELKDTWRI